MHDRGDALLFFAGVFLALGAGAAIFVLGPALAAARLGTRLRPGRVRRALPEGRAGRPAGYLRALAWSHPQLLWGALALAAALAAGILLGLRG